MQGKELKLYHIYRDSYGGILYTYLIYDSGDYAIEAITDLDLKEETCNSVGIAPSEEGIVELTDSKYRRIFIQAIFASLDPTNSAGDYVIEGLTQKEI